MNKLKLKHYLEIIDTRAVSLELMIDAVSNAVNTLESKLDNDCYDGLWLLEEAEPVLGLGFIALQNYINGTIADTKTKLSKEVCYKAGSNGDGLTNIDLIIGLANYAKHKEDRIFAGTKAVLDHFQLDCSKCVDIEQSPIIKGLKLLNNNSDIKAIKTETLIWREQLWTLIHHEREVKNAGLN